MDLIDMSWADNPALDVHILRNWPATVDLRTLLEMTFINPDATVAVDALTNDQRNALVGGAVTFAPQYPFTAAQHFISVDPGSGIVTTTIPSTANPRINNFIVRARAQQIQPDPAKQPFLPFSAYIRFHIHDAFVASSLRLSPARLTVGLGASASSFDVLGEFTDGIVADLTNTPGIDWQLFEDLGGGNLQLVPPGLDGDSTRKGVTLTVLGDITVAADADPNVKLKVKCVLDAYPPNVGEAMADIAIGPSWSRPFLIKQLAGPGPDERARVSNILLVSEGFTAAQEQLFDRYASNLVAALKDNQLAMPFNQLFSRNLVNVYSGFVPSPDSGATVDRELTYITVTKSATRESDEPSRPGDGELIDKLSPLMYAIGQPVPADAAQPGETRAQALQRLHDKLVVLQLDVFQTLLESDLDKLFDRWVRNAVRTMPLRRDTAFGVVNGNRPSASGNAQFVFKFRDLVFSQQNLFALVAGAEVNAGGPSIGDVWQATGKDRTLIVLLCNGVPTGGTNVAIFSDDGPNSFSTRSICVGLGRYFSPIWTKPVSGSRLVELDPDPLRDTPYMGVYGSLLHEIGHSLECDEEYGYSESDIPDPRANRARLRGNVVPLNVLLLDPANPNNAADFHMDNALWGFSHRIRTAGVLFSSPDTTNQRIQLRAGHGKLFAALKENDPLYLRTRPLMFGMEVFDTAGTARGKDRFQLTRSVEFKFKKISGPLEPDVIIVEGLPADITPWQVPGRTGLEPILYAPKQDANGKVLTLTAQIIRDHIEAKDLPLNRLQGACAPDVILDETKEILRHKVVPKNLPAGLSSAGNEPLLSTIVGLMDRGANFSCGIFHSAGACIMNVTNDPIVINEKKSFQAAIGGIMGYCHVCRYLLTDFLDPRLHGELDDLYPEVK